MVTLFEIQMKELNGTKKKRNPESLIKFTLAFCLMLSMVGKILNQFGIVF